MTILRRVERGTPSAEIVDMGLFRFNGLRSAEWNEAAARATRSAARTYSSGLPNPVQAVAKQWLAWVPFETISHYKTLPANSLRLVPNPRCQATPILV